MSQTPDPFNSPPPTSPERRQILQWSAVGLGTLATFLMGIPLVGYILGTIIKRKPNEWVDLGALGKFPESQTVLVDFDLSQFQPWDGQTQRTSGYVRHKDDGGFQVFAINCAHLGCPVAWFPTSGLFMCPCHGGVYYEDGGHASGPPPRGLFEYDTRFVRPGNKATDKPTIVEADEYEKLKGPERNALHLQIKAGHVPTLNNPLRQPAKGEKA